MLDKASYDMNMLDLGCKCIYSEMTNKLLSRFGHYYKAMLKQPRTVGK